PGFCWLQQPPRRLSVVIRSITTPTNNSHGLLYKPIKEVEELERYGPRGYHPIVMCWRRAE
ncbi:hypothetical protein BO83DRAFT_455467, partial [Aspergillus eucalypticola CBS 122712]